MTCKDCVHYEVCGKCAVEGMDSDQFLFESRCPRVDFDCPHYKPKSRFVEVVLCKDCKYRGDFSCPMCYEEKIDYDDDGYFETDYILHDRTTDNGFCDYGEEMKEREKE